MSLEILKKIVSQLRKDIGSPVEPTFSNISRIKPILLSTLPCEEWLLGGATTKSQWNLL
jgi:hypothetical protein